MSQLPHMFSTLTAGLFVERTDWKLPEALYGPMVYWIFVCSVMGYYVVTFATQHLPASQVGPLLRRMWPLRSTPGNLSAECPGCRRLQVASFQCLQPFAGTMLAWLVLGEQPSIYDLGAVGVVAGLVMVAYDRKDQPPHPILTRMRRAFSLKDLAGKEKRELLAKDKHEAEALL